MKYIVTDTSPSTFNSLEEAEKYADRLINQSGRAHHIAQVIKTGKKQGVQWETAKEPQSFTIVDIHAHFAKLMRETTDNQGKCWSDIDDITLDYLWCVGSHNQCELANLFGRSPHAIRCRLLKLGTITKAEYEEMYG